VKIKGKFRFKVEVEHEHLIRAEARGITVDEERARKLLNGKEVKKVFLSSNRKVVSLRTRSVNQAAKRSSSR